MRNSARFGRSVDDVESGAGLGVLDHLYPDGEGVLDGLHVCDHQDLLEFVADYF